MRYFLLLVVIASFAVSVAAQLPSGYIEVTAAGTATGDMQRGDNSCRIDKNQVFDAPGIKQLLSDPKCEDALRNMGFTEAAHTLIGWHAASDCHMRVRTKIFRSEADKKYLVIVNKIYGGCRAGGWRTGLILLEKIPAEYSVDIKEVKVDRIHSPQPGADDFMFPKLPTGIKPEVLESREIDVKDCLPLDRQSQWIFIKAEFLKSGLERFPETEKLCKEYFDGLKIDFTKYDLAGYNFNTGHCYRPQGIEQRVIKDYDEEVYRLEIAYPKTRASCHALRYFPIWVLVPKPPLGYKFDIVAKAKVEE